MANEEKKNDRITISLGGLIMAIVSICCIASAFNKGKRVGGEEMLNRIASNPNGINMNRRITRTDNVTFVMKNNNHHHK